MAETQHTTSRRGILAFLAAAPIVALPAMPAMPAVPSLSQMMSGTSWAGCLAEYHAALAAKDAAGEAMDLAQDACKAKRGEVPVPEGLRWGWRLLGRSWLEMSVEEIRQDLMVRNQAPNTPKKRALIEKDMKGVADFKAELARIEAEALPAELAYDAAYERHSEAEDRLGEYQVATVTELAQKMVVAREVGGWLLERVETDAKRLGGLV